MRPKPEKKTEWQKLKHLIVGRLVVLKKFPDPERLKSIRCNHGKGLIHVAAKHSFAEIVQYLIESGCDVNLKNDKNGITPLIYAIKRKDTEQREKIIEILIRSGADPLSASEIIFNDPYVSGKFCSVLRRVHDYDDKKAADHLLTKGWTLVNVDSLKDPELVKKAVGLLVKSESKLSLETVGTDIYKNPALADKLCTALYLKHEKSYKKVAQILVRKGWTLDQVAFLRNDQLVDCVLRSDSNLNENYKKLLDAVEREDVTRIKELFEIVSHSKRVTSWLLLEAAAKQTSRSPVILKLLLDCGAPVDGFEIDNWTPLETALMSCHVDNVWVLLENGSRLANRRFLRALRDKLNNRDGSARRCIRLLFEYQGLWQKNVEPTFENVMWLSLHQPTDYPILTLVFEFLSRTRPFVQPQDEYLPLVYRQTCNRYYENMTEIATNMKNCHLESDRSLSLWSLMTKSIDELVVITKNQELMKQINEVLLSAPTIINVLYLGHGHTLFYKLEMAKKRRRMIEESVKTLRTCLPLSGSVDPVIEKIVGYLGVPNLLNDNQNN